MTRTPSALDDLTSLAAQLCRCAGARIIRVEDSGYGTLRDFVVDLNALVILHAVDEDRRFGRDPLVTELSLKFYAAAPLRAADGGVLGLLCVYDVVDRRLNPAQRRGLEALARRVAAEFRPRAEIEALRASKLLGQRVLESMPIGVFVKDIRDEFRYLSVNPLAAELIGLNPEQCVGKTDFDLFSADEAMVHRSRDLETIRMGHLRVFDDLTVEHQSQGPVPMRVRYLVIFDDRGAPAYLVGLSEDIRAEKESARVIEDQRVRLVNASKFSALGEMAGGLAHEINNPLAIIRGRASALKRNLEAAPVSPERLRIELTKIEDTTDRIGRIIRGLKMFSRNAELDPIGTASVREIIDETLELCRERITHNGTALTLNLGESHDVVCRPTQISQILMNLLNNAFDAIQGLPDRWIQVAVEYEPDAALIRVTDCGHGIPPELARKIMTPFFTTKAIGHGTGLGLSISKSLAEDNGGALEYNAAAEHTQFVLRLARPHGTSARKSA